ncbi:MAG TPA: TIGR04290 family methyltransferase [Gammaproteobacteria bacterium]|nr:TIGR04290 family methyltransferase [Gammaproteobacteria bacterium]
MNDGLATLQSPGSAAGPLADQVQRLGPWFHNLHLPDGTQTAPDHPLGDFPAFKWEQLAPHLPADLTGWRVLDIGCNAGFYSFELARRGADVLGIDEDPHYLKQARWARRRLNLGGQVRFKQMGVYQLAKMQETFDLVLFLGVFYHLRYPLLALDRIADKIRRRLLFQSLSLPGDAVATDVCGKGYLEIDDLAAPEWPRMAFVEHDFAGDTSNWWIPNKAAIEALLRTAGFRILACPAEGTYVCEPGNVARA